MAKKRGKRRSDLPTVEAVLSGAVVPDLPTLLKVLHRVNPTGRQLPRAETERRYADKAGLQALVLKRFGSQFRAEQTGEDEILLRHTSGTQDACHARVSALDEDSKIWVRRSLVEQDQVDAGEQPTPAGPAPSTSASRPKSDPLSAAREALEFYDYDAAEQHLHEARCNPTIALAATRLLLVLRVDHLGQDGKAIALGGTLAGALRKDPVIRSLLALAAARLGRPAEARRWRQGAAQGREGLILAALAEHALKRDDLAEAAQILAALKAWPEQTARRRALEEQLEERRSEARAPAEAACSELLEAGRLDEAAAAAEKLLLRWPGSEVGKRVFHAVESHRRAERAADLRAQAEAAEAAGSLDIAESRWRSLMDLGDSQAKAGLRRVRRQRTERLAAKRRSEVRSLLARGGLAGLTAWCGLDAPDRTLLADAMDTRRASALEEGLAAWGQRRVDHVIDVVLRLEQAEKLAADGDDDAALAALDDLDGGPRRLRRGKSLHRDLERRALAQREAAAWKLLEQIEPVLALERQDKPIWEAILAALNKIDLRGLSDGVKEMADGFRAEIMAALRFCEWEQLVDRGSWTEADERAAAGVEEDPAWKPRLGQARVHAQEQWKARVWGLLDLPVIGRIGKEACGVSVTLDSGNVFVADSLDRQVLVRVVELETGRVLQRFSCLTPEPLELMEVYVDAERLILLGRRAILVLDRVAWRLSHYHRHEHPNIGDMVVTNDGHHVWSHTDRGEVEVLEADGFRSVGRLHRTGRLVAQRSLDADEVVVLDQKRGLRTRAGNGGPGKIRYKNRSFSGIGSFQLDPDGRKGWILTGGPEDGAVVGKPALWCYRLDLENGPQGASALDGTLQADGWCQLAIDGADQRAFVLGTAHGHGIEVYAVEEAPEAQAGVPSIAQAGVQPIWHAQVSYASHLITDATGTRVVLETHSGNGWAWVSLGRDLPDHGTPDDAIGVVLPVLKPSHLRPPDTAASRISFTAAERAVLAALRSATNRASVHDWNGASEALVGDDDEALRFDLGARLHFARGVVATWAGLPERAQHGFQRAHDLGKVNFYAANLGLLEGLWDLDPTPTVGTLARAIGGTVRRAAQAHQIGEFEAAWAAMNRPSCWLWSDVAPAALRARIALDRPDDGSDAQAWEKQVALAWLLESMRRNGTEAIALPGAAWMREPDALISLMVEARTALGYFK